MDLGISFRPNDFLWFSKFGLISLFFFVINKYYAKFVHVTIFCYQFRKEKDL